MPNSNLLLSRLPPPTGRVDIVERKGRGHPDTICDAMAEALSRRLCVYYRETFGTVLHHNVDKALLRGGSAKPAFGGGEVTAPMDIYLAGRAVDRVGTDRIPLDDLVMESARSWLVDNLPGLDPDRHVRIHNLLRPGSVDLVDVFERVQDSVPRANDTSVGVGYAPLNALERLVLRTEQCLTDRTRIDASPARGEDVKIMGLRSDNKTRLTIACAMIDRYLNDPADYEAERSLILTDVRTVAHDLGHADVEITVNAADEPQSGSYYLTVTGTSAESGDDGQVGRGNRANGLITPYRPMTLEAAAGKNPVNHVGKLYTATALRLSQALVDELEEVGAADCFLVSQIGRPITEPWLMDIRLSTAGDLPPDALRSRIEEIGARHLASIPHLLDEFIEGEIDLF